MAMADAAVIEKIDVNEVASRHKYKKFAVIFHNDDFTPMDFVIQLLETVFFYSKEESEDIMWKVHNEGKAVVGIFSRDVAETKKAQVDAYSNNFKQPLLCSVEMIDVD